jgi:hypothetical protein
MRAFGWWLAAWPMTAGATPVALTHAVRLVDGLGNPVSGAHDVRVTLYADSAGTTSLWTKSFPVDVADGYATVTLDTGDGSVALDAQWFAAGAWLGTKLDTLPEMTPRTPITEVPAAAVAGAVPVFPTTTPATCSDGSVGWSRSATTLLVCDQGTWRGTGGGGGASAIELVSANPAIGRMVYADRLVDGFTDLSGINAGASVNLVRVPQGYIVGGTGTIDTTDLVPTRTDNTNVLYSSLRGTEYAWYAFDDSHLGAPLEVLDRFWGSATSPTYPQFLGYDFGAGNAKVVTGYTLRARQDCCTNANPKDWELQGSNNGSTWTTLHIGSYNSWAQSGANNLRTYTFSNTTAYRYYRVNIVANGGHSDVNIGQLELMGQPFAPADLTAQGQPLVTSTAPSHADLVVLVADGVGATTLGTDLKAWVSRNGTNFAEVTLTVEGTFGANGRIAAARNVDLSALASGTSLTWKVTTHNQGSTKSTHLYGVSLAVR